MLHEISIDTIDIDTNGIDTIGPGDVMMSEQAGFARCIAPSDEGVRWGIQVRSCGWNNIPAGGHYPPTNHPQSRAIDGQRGRVLREGQFMFITQGSGTFWSSKTGELPIQAGTAIVLFPGMVHDYRPDPEAGWHEYWVTLAGPFADRFWTEIFNPANPTIRVGDNGELVSAFLAICEMVEFQGQGLGGRLAAKSMEIASILHQNTIPKRSTQDSNVVAKACSMMAESVDETVDFEKFADSVSMSYTAFRRLFKQHTGMAPKQYLLKLRLEKSRRLLKNTFLSVEQISDTVGFSSVSYFSRFFKERTGVSPLKFRTQVESHS